MIKPEVLPSILEGRSSTKQELLINFRSMPFVCIGGVGSYRLRGTESESNFCFYLPMLLTSFSSFLKAPSKEEFLGKWDALVASGVELQSGPVPLSPQLIESTFDFKQFFSLLVLNPEEEIQHIENKVSLHFGGCFEIETPGNEYMLRIEVSPLQRGGGRRAVFSIASNEFSAKKAELMLQTLIYLFKED